MMSRIQNIFHAKAHIFTALAVISFSNFMIVLFGQTIPGIFIAFFKIAGEYLILGAVCIFALTWFLKAKPHNRPKKYSLMIFDVFGKKSQIEGIRTEFKTLDVAWSFMKQYKKSHSLHNFALISGALKLDSDPSEKPTIVRYI